MYIRLFNFLNCEWGRFCACSYSTDRCKSVSHFGSSLLGLGWVLCVKIKMTELSVGLSQMLYIGCRRCALCYCLSLIALTCWSAKRRQTESECGASAGKTRPHCKQVLASAFSLGLLWRTKSTRHEWKLDSDFINKTVPLAQGYHHLSLKQWSVSGALSGYHILTRLSCISQCSQSAWPDSTLRGDWKWSPRQYIKVSNG